MNQRILCAALLFCMLFAACPVYSQPGRPADVDSVLYHYFRKCTSNLNKPEALPLADTLYELAGQKGDRRMQAAALSHKADHYYRLGQKDSMLVYMKECQDFARKYDQLKYYYFVWGKLIAYYNNRHEYNLALFEIDRMKEQAKKDDYKEGIFKSYQETANVYFYRQMFDVAADYYRKAIKFVKVNEIKDYNIHVLYTSYSQALTQIGQYDRALESLREAEPLISSPRYIYSIKYGYFDTYLAMGETEKARKYLDELLVQSRTPEGVPMNSYQLPEAQARYYFKTGQYRRALEYLDELTREWQKAGIDGTKEFANIKMRAESYLNLGDTASGVKYLKRYIELAAAQAEADAKTQIDEFAVLMDVERLNAENSHLEITLQQDKLEYNQKLILVLSFLLVSGVVFILVLFRLNRKLAWSKADIEQKNTALSLSESALRDAKEKAEKASEMKTVFIQNISHEVRTPLNSIVGFSELIASLSTGQEVEEYADIVRRNNAALLGIMDDVLCISDLESSPSTMEKAKMDVEACCKVCLDKVRSRIKEGVELVFSPLFGKENSILSSHYGIEIVLSRLLDNAAKFTEKGRIELSYNFSPDGKELSFVVTDTGTGVPEGWDEEIFERFTKADTFYPGLGLGLAIARLVANKLGGAVALDRSYKNGSRFVFSVPTGV